MSNETKWTPGPWSVYPGSDGTEICAVTRVPLLPVRQRIANPVRGDNWIANAHLIAAAPELYEALCDILAEWQYYAPDYPLVDKALDALAKARGEEA